MLRNLDEASCSFTLIGQSWSILRIGLRVNGSSDCRDFWIETRSWIDKQILFYTFCSDITPWVRKCLDAAAEFDGRTIFGTTFFSFVLARLFCDLGGWDFLDGSLFSFFFFLFSYPISFVLPKDGPPQILLGAPVVIPGKAITPWINRFEGKLQFLISWYVLEHFTVILDTNLDVLTHWVISKLFVLTDQFFDDCLICSFHVFLTYPSVL